MSEPHCADDRRARVPLLFVESRSDIAPAIEAFNALLDLRARHSPDAERELLLGVVVGPLPDEAALASNARCRESVALAGRWVLCWFDFPTRTATH